MNDSKITKLIELATTAGFTSTKYDVEKEETLYFWLVELQKWFLQHHRIDIDVTLTNDKYQCMVFNNGLGLITQLYEPNKKFDEKDDALIYILTKTFQYLNNTSIGCSHCNSSNVDAVQVGDFMGLHCSQCGSISLDGETVGGVAGYNDVTPDSNDLGENFRWIDTESLDLYTGNSISIAENGSTQYESTRNRRYSNRIQRADQDYEEVPRFSNEADPPLYSRESLDLRAQQRLQTNDEPLRLRDYQEVNLDREGRARIRYHEIPESLRQDIDADRFNVAIEEAQTELDRLSQELFHELTRETGMIPINSTINSNDDF
jgi:hypothetical protein